MSFFGVIGLQKPQNQVSCDCFSGMSPDSNTYPIKIPRKLHVHNGFSQQVNPTLFVLISSYQKGIVEMIVHLTTVMPLQLADFDAIWGVYDLDMYDDEANGSLQTV